MADRILRILHSIGDFFRRPFFRKINVRILILVIVVCGVAGGLIYRLFMLQIVNGDTYLSSFQLRIRRVVSIPAARGNIYDCNGNLLAYNEISYTVTMNDYGESSAAHDRELNSTIERVIDIVEGNGDSMTTDFDIIYNSETGHYEFTVEGTSLLRFRADVYGHANISDLTDFEEYATADDMISYLCSARRFRIGSYDDPDNPTSDTFHAGQGYTPERRLQIVICRYLLGLNSYQRYIAATLAENVSEKTVAAILENTNQLEGVSITDKTIRKYNDSKYFAQLLGYTGEINQDELTSLQQENPDYASGDQVGKSGIEASQELVLQGTKGSETVYVDNMGNTLETTDVVEPVAGNDVYLTIDRDLTIAAYEILERKLADIIYDRIVLTKTWTLGEDEKKSNIRIPIYDVYFQMFNNNIIDMDHLTADDASDTEKVVYEAWQNYQSSGLQVLRTEMETAQRPYNELTDELKDYESYIVQKLKNDGVLVESRIDTEDQTYIDWTTNEIISMAEFLRYAIAQDWVDTTVIGMNEQYADSADAYRALTDYIISDLSSDDDFTKHLYHYMIQNDVITGTQIAEILLDQGIVAVDSVEEENLRSGAEEPAIFFMNRIKNLDLTPDQLALDPCSGSMVITDPDTGDVKALVTYPGYDNNKMANTVDAEYYAQLQGDSSGPLLNHATQQRTAPGSTFKPVTATAGLLEGVLTTTDQIDCFGLFDKINPPVRCWVYPEGHGFQTLSQGISNSCNVFFGEVGYRLGTDEDGNYDSDLGLQRLDKYVSMYGLDEKSGVEIEEYEPRVSSQDAVRSAFGQGNAAYTTVGLARYATAVANSGTCYDLTLIDKINDAAGNLVEDNTAKIRNVINMDQEYWDAIHRGMKGVVDNMAFFIGFPVQVAGKTGTAEEAADRPNHALFICYAPYENPDIVVATRIPNGYTSSYAAQITESVLSYYFGNQTLDEILNETMDTEETIED